MDVKWEGDCSSQFRLCLFLSASCRERNKVVSLLSQRGREPCSLMGGSHGRQRLLHGWGLISVLPPPSFPTKNLHLLPPRAQSSNGLISGGRGGWGLTRGADHSQRHPPPPASPHIWNLPGHLEGRLLARKEAVHIRHSPWGQALPPCRGWANSVRLSGGPSCGLWLTFPWALQT